MDKIFSPIVLILFFVAVITGIIKDQTSPEHQSEVAERDKRCTTPRLVAEIDGVKLYAINHPADHCWDRPVYFSKSGIKTDHSERHGKSHETIDDVVINIEEK